MVRQWPSLLGCCEFSYSAHELYLRRELFRGRPHSESIFFCYKEVKLISRLNQHVHLIGALLSLDSFKKL